MISIRTAVLLGAIGLALGLAVRVAAAQQVSNADRAAAPAPLARCLDTVGKIRAVHKGIANKLDTAEVAAAVRWGEAQARLAQQTAVGCLRAVAVDRVPAVWLPELADVQLVADDRPGALATLRRIADDRTEPAAGRHAALRGRLTSIRPADAATVALLRRTAALADTLGDAVVRLNDYSALAGATRVVDSLQVYAVAARAIPVLAALSDSARRSAAVERAVAMLVSDVTRWAAEDKEPSRGNGFTARVMALMGSDAAFVDQVAMLYDLAAMVGAPAPPIRAPRWFNLPAGASGVDLADGQVTLVEFTGWWCVGCKVSYAPLQALYEKLGARGFRVVFATGLYGGFEGRAATPEQEIAADRGYFVEHYGLRFPIAIADASRSGLASEYVSGPNSRAYFVNGVPHFVLIDRHGVVRRVWIGWDPSPDSPALAAIEQLLQEST